MIRRSLGPAQGRDLLGCAALVLPILAIAVAAGMSESGAVQSAAKLMLISVVAVVGIQIYSGNSGVISFGHAAFMALGAYMAAWLTVPPALKATLLPGLPGFLAGMELSLWAAIPVVIVVTAVIALLIGIGIGRLDGASGAIATLGLLVIGYSVLIGARDITRGSQALYGLPLVTTITMAFLCAAAAIVAARMFRGSGIGLELRAAREDTAAARSSGVDVVRQRTVAWVLSAVVVAVAGALYGHQIGVLTPRTFYFDMTFILLAMLIVGGMTTVSGAVTGAVMISLLVEVLRRVEGGVTLGPIATPEIFGLTNVGLALAILAVMYWRRQGLAGHLEFDERLRTSRAPPAKPRAPVATGAGADAGRLEIEAVSKSFAGLLAVDQVSLTLARGEIIGLIGPNGAGKSTLLGLASGTLAPTQGRIRLDGHDITGWPPDRIAKRGIARTFQNIRLFKELSVLDNVRVAAAVPVNGPRPGPSESEERALELLDRFGLSDVAHRPARTLAYGPQRRLEIARAVALRPRFVFLDEPAAGMNPSESDEMLKTLERLRADMGIGILVVDHDLRLIMRLCERVAVMHKGGKIAEGPPEEVQNDPAVIEAYLGRRKAADAAAAGRATTPDGVAALAPKSADSSPYRED